MIYWKYPMGLCVLACSLSISAASGQQLNPQQIQLIRDTAASICNTVKDTKGQKTDLQLEGDVKAQLNGLVGKIVDVGGAGKGSLTREEFEGLSREATGSALESDRGCRERVFDKMFDKITIVIQRGSNDTASEKLVGYYQVLLGPRGGCNGGVPNSYPRQLARIVSDGNSLTAYNECGMTTTVSIADDKTIYFFGERGEVSYNGDSVLIKADDGNAWQKVRSR